MYSKLDEDLAIRQGLRRTRFAEEIIPENPLSFVVFFFFFSVWDLDFFFSSLLLFYSRGFKLGI